MATGHKKLILLDAQRMAANLQAVVAVDVNELLKLAGLQFSLLDLVIHVAGFCQHNQITDESTLVRICKAMLPSDQGPLFEELFATYVAAYTDELLRAKAERELP